MEYNAKHGKDRILLFRTLKEAGEVGAAKLALQTEHTWSYDRSVDSTQTKDGTVTYDSGLEVTLDINAVISDDPVNNMLYQAVINGDKIEVWDVDLSIEGGTPGTYKAKYAQGLLESWEDPASVEDLSELSTSMRIDGIPKEGDATLTEDQEEEIMYAFRDTQVVTDVG